MRSALRPAPRHGHAEGVVDEVGAQVVAHRPADAVAAAGVDHRRQVEPALPGGHVGDVGEPELVGSLGREVALHEVGGGRSFAARGRRAHPVAPPA